MIVGVRYVALSSWYLGKGWGALSELSSEPAGRSGEAADDMRRRSGLVHKAMTEWKGALVDLGGRNNLLHYRDLKRGTLDLTSAE